jgi:hypothetical protein
MYCGSRIEHTGISFANMNQYEEAAKAYVQALHLTPSAKYVQYSHSIALSTNCSHPPSSPIVLILPSLIYLTFSILPSPRHIWGYLRVVFTSMDRLDLSELSSLENTQTLADKLGITLIHPH